MAKIASPKGRSSPKRSGPASTISPERDIPQTETIQEKTAQTIAAAEVSLHQNVLKIKEKHALEDLGISFYDYETTIQWAYNADAYSAYEEVFLRLVSGNRLRIGRDTYTPVGMKGWYHAIFRRDSDGSERLLTVDQLLKKIDDWKP